MTTKAIAAAISALALIQIATPVLAAPNDLGDRRIEQLLRQLATKDSPTQKAALTTVSANIKVVGTIRRVSNFTLPLTCDLFLFDRSGHDEEKSAPVIFTGNVGTCTVEIPFKWANVDPADDPVEINVFVSNVVQNLPVSAAETPSFVARSSSLDFPDIPLPLQNSKTTVTFDIRM